MTNLLLDTHAFIWYSADDSKLLKSIKIEIEIADRVCISIASLSEIAIKLSIGKLSLRSNYESIKSSLKPAGIYLLPISFADTVRVMNLPLHHRDPFDRILTDVVAPLLLSPIAYAHEMTDTEHRELPAVLRNVQGKVAFDV